MAARNTARFAPRDFSNGIRLIPDEGPNEGRPYSFGDIEAFKITTGGSTKEIPGLGGSIASVVPGQAKPTVEIGASSSEETVGALKHLSGGQGNAYGTRFTLIAVGQRRGVNDGNPREYKVLGCLLNDGGGLDVGSDSAPKDSLKAAGSDLLIDGESLFNPADE